MELNQKDFADLQHLLPPSFASVVVIVGLENAFKLVQKYRGTSFKIGRNQRKAGKVLHFSLAEVVGEDAATRIETALEGQRELYVPKCDDVLRELRNRQIRREFDELTLYQSPPMLATTAENSLALAYQLSARQIRSILTEPDKVPSRAQQSQQSQYDLFVA